jgi:hypothetical protein
LLFEVVDRVADARFSELERTLQCRDVVVHIVSILEFAVGDSGP